MLTVGKQYHIFARCGKHLHAICGLLVPLTYINIKACFVLLLLSYYIGETMQRYTDISAIMVRPPLFLHPADRCVYKVYIFLEPFKDTVVLAVSYTEVNGKSPHRQQYKRFRVS